MVQTLWLKHSTVGPQRLEEGMRAFECPRPLDRPDSRDGQ